MNLITKLQSYMSLFNFQCLCVNIIMYSTRKLFTQIYISYVYLSTNAISIYKYVECTWRKYMQKENTYVRRCIYKLAIEVRVFNLI
jgi:hypothetical protein